LKTCKRKKNLKRSGSPKKIFNFIEPEILPGDLLPFQTFHNGYSLDKTDLGHVPDLTKVGTQIQKVPGYSGRKWEVVNGMKNLIH
jgi:hypothetical protein